MLSPSAIAFIAIEPVKKGPLTKYFTLAAVGKDSQSTYTPNIAPRDVIPAGVFGTEPAGNPVSGSGYIIKSC